MPRYIDAIAAQREIEIVGHERFLTSGDVDEVKLFLEEQPTADVTPVVHAHWEERGAYYKCSLCGDSIASQLEMEHCAGRKWDFCPCCGAKMDEESKQ